MPNAPRTPIIVTNPTGASTERLNKITIGGLVFDVPGDGASGGAPKPHPLPPVHGGTPGFSDILHLNRPQFFVNNFMREGSALLSGIEDYEYADSPNLDNLYKKSLTRRAGIVADNGEGGFYSSEGAVIDLDLGESQLMSNAVVKLTAAEPKYQSELQDMAGVLEISDTPFSSSYDGQNGYTPKFSWLAGRPDDEHFFFYMPNNTGSRYVRIKLLFRSPGTTFYPERFEFRDIFVGDSVRIDRGVAYGAIYKLVDPSIRVRTESGLSYAFVKRKYRSFPNITIEHLRSQPKGDFRAFIADVGITRAFWIALDPRGEWDVPPFSSTFGPFYLTEMPTFDHEFYDYETVSLALEEALIGSVSTNTNILSGPRGIKGLKGDSGDQGIKGPPGEQGIPGEQGPEGVVTPAASDRFIEYKGFGSVLSNGQFDGDAFGVNTGASIRTGTGTYAIPLQQNAISVVATPVYSGVPLYAEVRIITFTDQSIGTRWTVRIRNVSGSLVDSAFNFIAVGTPTGAGKGGNT